MEQKQNGVYKRFTMFILEDHDTDMDLWPWWGEPIFRNGRYVGKTTSSAYSYTLERHVCLGFVQHFDEKTGEELVVTTDFINQGEYEIDIAGQRFLAQCLGFRSSCVTPNRLRFSSPTRWVRVVGMRGREHQGHSCAMLLQLGSCS